MRYLPLALVLVGLLTAFLTAQGLVGVVTPPVQSPGQPVVISLSNPAPVPLEVTNLCVIDEVRRGSPLGPAVFSPSCPPASFTVPVGGSLSGFWPGTDDGGVAVAPDMYFMRVSWTAPGLGFVQSDFYPVDMRGGRPVLSTQTLPTRAQPFMMELSAPTRGGDAYITALSFFSNFGQDLGPVFLALDADPLFQLTLFFGLGAPFQNMTGNLDVTGGATGIGLLDIPDVPWLADAPMRAQTLIYGSGVPVTSNALSLVIQ